MPATTTERRKTRARSPKGSGKACRIEGCSAPTRRRAMLFHYDKWKAGELRSALRTCSKKAA